MFTEILRIRPILDPAGAKQMEASLHSRFSNVAKRFGGGLKAIIKGSVLGISIGLLNRLLNPLEAVEDRIKALLAQGTDLADLSERLGSSGGQLKRVESVAQSLGIKPDQLKEVLTKFADEVEQARTELKNPFLERSTATLSLQETIGNKGILQKNTLDSFLTFLQQIKKEGQGTGGRLLRDSVIQQLSGEELRKTREKEVLGGLQFGGVKRLIDTDFNKQAVKINLPSEQVFNRAIKNTGDAAKFQNEKQAESENQSFIKDAGNISNTIIKMMEDAKIREEKHLSDQISSYQDIRKGADAVEDIKEGIQNILSNITNLVGMMGQITQFIPKVTNSRWWNGALKSMGF